MQKKSTKNTNAKGTPTDKNAANAQEKADNNIIDKLPKIEETKQEPINVPEIKPIKDATSDINKLSSTAQDFRSDKFAISHLFFKEQFEKTLYQIRQRSKSPKNKIITPTHKRGNGIPKNTIEKMNFLDEIFSNDKFNKYFLKAPLIEKSDLDKITEYLSKFKGIKDDLDVLAMFYYYICKTIDYDFNAQKDKHIDPVYKKPDCVLRNKYALADGFCNLFAYMCNKKGFKVKIINGYCKLLPNNIRDFQRDASPKKLLKSSSGHNVFKTEEKKESTIINHTWCAVIYKGEWYFVDPMLGAGGTYKRKIEEKPTCNIYYFLTSPELMIYTHRPEDEDYQFLDKTVSYSSFLRRKFCDFGKFYDNAYKTKIEILSGHDFPMISQSLKTPLILQYRKKDTYFQGELYTNNFKEKLGEIKNETNEFTFITKFYPTFPGNGEYIIKIGARPYTSNDLFYTDAFEYRIKIGDISPFNFKHTALIAKKKLRRFSTSLIPTTNNVNVNRSQPGFLTPFTKTSLSSLPKIGATKKICFDNEGAYLIEPRPSQHLKKYSETSFKVRVQGARSVAVLDGRKMNYLKRLDENLFGGTLTINSDFVSICSLRSSNVFTEVFTLKVKGEAPRKVK